MGKKANGRKRHIAVDTIGLLLTVLITAAAVQDRDAARLLLWNLRKACPAGGWSSGHWPGSPRCRRTVRDYERLIGHHETIAYWSMIITMSRRLARNPGQATDYDRGLLPGCPVWRVACLA